MRRAVWPVVIAFAGGLACGPSAGSSWRRGANGRRGTDDRPKPVVRTVEFAPGGEPASRYNDPAVAPAPASPLGDALVAVVGEVAVELGLPAPAADARLYAVAADLATLLEGDALPPYDAVEFALSHHGLIEPSPQLVVIVADGDDPGAVVLALRPKLPEALSAGDFGRVGVGTAPAADGLVTIVLALQESGLETEPIPRTLPHGGAAPLRGQVREPFASPALYVTGADGQVEKVPVAHDGARGFRAELRCGDADGRRQVEITARGPRGVTVLANFPVWCGEAPPRDLALSIATGGAPITDFAEAEAEVLDLLNADRRAAGLPELMWDDRVAAIARAHSQDMHDNGFVGHVSPTTGTAGDRMRAGGVGTPVVLENVARAYSPAEAQLGFMNSPGHRANVLSREVTHVGVGVVLGREVAGRRELFVTQLFFQIPGPLDVAAGVRAARVTIDRVRADANLAALRRDRDLDAVAVEFAAGLAKGGDQAQLAARAGDHLDGLADRYDSVVTVVLVVGDPGDVASDRLRDPAFVGYGIGMAQGNDDQVGEGAIFVVIVLARGR